MVFEFMAEIKALVFDVDGTLADTEKDGHRIAFNRAFAKAGLAWEWSVERYGELLAVTGGKERIKHFMQESHPEFLDKPDLENFIAGLHASKTEFYKSMMAQGIVPLRTGVERLLREARDAGMTLAIATTTTPENVTALISNTLGEEAMAWFEVIGAGDVVPAKKPAPDIYQWVLKALGLQPEEAIAFEDSENGVISAADAGIRRIVITINDYTAQHDFSRAPVVLDHLGEPDQPPQVLKGHMPAQAVDLAWLAQL
jgi:HAD superfamily hydrolase (TIGR01509 family)